MTAEERAKCEDLAEQCHAANQSATARSREIHKTPARSAAGIYAKALCVRQSVTGAAALGKSLADDLVANDVPRRLPWSDAGISS